MNFFAKARHLLELGKGVTAEAAIVRSKDCSETLQTSIWSKYVAYRSAGCIAPFHVRRTPYKVKLFTLDSYIIKEYSGARDKVEKEVAILQQLHHENLISFLFVADQGSRISIVMDWAGESLRRYRTLSVPQQDNEAVARHVVYQLTNALVYLHNKGIIHRDIKPDNIGVQKDHKVALFDWGEALTTDQVDLLTDRALAQQVGVAGTPLFMPPEVLNYLTDRDLDPKGFHQLRSIITTKVDIWGLGTVLFFLLAGRDIFINGSSWELSDLADIAGASTGVELPLGVEASYAARDFLKCCLERDPECRASAKDLWQHPWLMGASTHSDMQAAELASKSALATAPSIGTRTAMLSVLAESFSSEGDEGDEASSSSSSSAAAAVAAAVAAAAATAAGMPSYYVSANPLLDSLALTSGMASLKLASQPLQAGATLQGLNSVVHLQHSGLVSGSLQQYHHQQHLAGVSSCKSLAAAEAAAGAEIQLGHVGNGAVCEVRLRPSPSGHSLISSGSASPVQAAG